MIALVGRRCVPRQLGDRNRTSDFPVSSRGCCLRSNIGGATINDVALDFWHSGQNREDIGMEDMEHRLRAETVESQGNAAGASGELYSLDRGEPVTPVASSPQVASRRASSCRDTWSTSSCRSSPWSTGTSSCARATPTWRGAWSRTRPRWTRWPRPCCTSPGRRDCSRPRGASPSLRGSTSSSRRGAGVSSALPARQRWGGNASALIHTHTHTPRQIWCRCQRHGGGARYLSSVTPPTPSTHPCFDETAEDDCFHRLCRVAFRFCHF